MTAIQITRLDAKDTAKAIEVFFAAFERDPLMSYLFGDRYRDLAKRTMQYVCDRANLLNLPLLVLSLQKNVFLFEVCYLF